MSEDTDSVRAEILRSINDLSTMLGTKPRKDRVKQLGQIVAAIILICLAIISVAITIGVWQWLVN